MIYINKLEIDRIVNQAKKEFPNECCGFLSGSKSEDIINVKKSYPLTNLDKSSEHFSMDPKEQFNTIKIIRGNDMLFIGNYHSHPYTPSRPSEEDIRLAYDPKIIYGILSLEKEEPVFNLFKINKNGVLKLEYKII
ncbi:M67 family metallopeptidase [Clostridium sp.]|uniref:M67 family metallopeptidase n=1 Tax=Clostridium sp. TaxID=1506 RepID=UPI002611A2FE|nr:M67 family metallopeptidase [uncultured Clostridium sp.]